MIYFVGPESNHSKFPRATVSDVLDYFKDKDEYQGDTETEGQDPHQKKIVALQFGDRDNQFVIDARYHPVHLFEPILLHKHGLWHNAKFDYKFLKMAGVVIEDIYDTMLAETVIYNGYQDWGYGLDDCTWRYLRVKLDKDSRGEFYKLKDKPFSDKQIEYAGRDVMHLQDIRDKQLKKIEKYDLHRAVELENQALKALADIELNGMYLDADEWLSIAQSNEQELIDAEIDMDEYLLKNNYGYERNEQLDAFSDKQRKIGINYNSPTQVLDMFRRAGLPLNDTQDLTLQQYSDLEIVSKLKDIREINKKVSTYGRGFLDYINPKTGRVHTDFWQMKNTFRLGSGNKKTNSPNVQNIPREAKYRACFKPRPGYKWVSLDYSGQEMRIMADFSEEWKLINAVNEGKDLHCFVGSMMLEKEIKKGDPERTEIKQVNFGKPYGMGAYKLAIKLGSSEEHAEELLKLHERTFDKLDRWLRKMRRFGKENGYILTNPLHKGRRWFPEMRQAQEWRQAPHPDWSTIMRIEGSVERQAGNTPVQGTGAVIMKEALVEIRELLKNYDAYLICTVHDQLDMEVREDQAQEVHDKAAEIMERVGNQYVQHVTMPVDGKVTDQWEK